MALLQNHIAVILISVQMDDVMVVACHADIPSDNRLYYGQQLKMVVSYIGL